MKKLIAIALTLVMLLPMVLTAVSADQYPALAEKTDQELYDDCLSEFYTLYKEALACTDENERWARQAMAEAKLLEAAVLLPAYSDGGSYAISRVVPKTTNSTLYGSDSDRQYSIVVTEELIQTEDRDSLKAMWNSADDAAAYVTEAKVYLEDKGYTFGDEYICASSADPTTWDVLNAYYETDTLPLVQLYDGLLMYDIMNTQQPALAVSYEVNEDSTVFTFKLREGVQWVDSQGQELGEVTADDWVAGMQHMLDSQAGLEYLVDGLIVGASQYLNGETTDFSTVGVKAVDDYTLQYTLTKSCPYFLSLLSSTIFAPMNRDYFLSQGGAFGIDELAAAKESGSYTYGTSPDTIAYNGPFLVTSYTENDTIVFEANPSYYNAESLGVHTLTWKYYDGTDNTKTYTDAVAGEITECELNAETVELAMSETVFDEYAFVTDTDATTTAFWLNLNRQAYANYTDSDTGVSNLSEDDQTLSNAAIRNVHFRRAVLYAINRSAVSAQAKGEERADDSIINAYVPGDYVYLTDVLTISLGNEPITFSSGTAYGVIRQAQLETDGSSILSYNEGIGSGSGYDGWYDPDEAVAELQTAIQELKNQGYEISADNPVHVEITAFTGNESYANQAQAVKESVEEVLGGVVIVDILGVETLSDWMDATCYPATGAEMNYNIGTGGSFTPAYDDPETYLDTLLPGGIMTRLLGLF